MGTNRYLYLFKTFLTLGSLSFGGYMSLISMIRTRMVERDKKVSDSDLTEAITIASLLPGPVAVNVVAYIGFIICGIKGAIISVFAILIPSFHLMLVSAYLYFEYQTVIDYSFVLVGIIPAVAGIIFTVAVKMWKQHCFTSMLMLIAIISALSIMVINSPVISIIVIFTAGVVGLTLKSDSAPTAEKKLDRFPKSLIILALGVPLILLGFGPFISQNINYKIIVEFSGISLSMFGGGYVVIPILNDLLINQLQWITNEEFIMGISLGQITPGPILISAVFFGYKVNGLMGASLATISIFLPSALLMIIVSHFYSEIRNSQWVGKSMRTIKAAVVGLIMYSSVALIKEQVATGDLLFSLFIAGLVIFTQLRFSVNSFWIIVFSSLLGAFYYYLVY